MSVCIGAAVKFAAITKDYLFREQDFRHVFCRARGNGTIVDNPPAREDFILLAGNVSRFDRRKILSPSWLSA
jgi:hypothetical protein